MVFASAAAASVILSTPICAAATANDPVASLMRQLPSNHITAIYEIVEITMAIIVPFGMSLPGS